MTPAAGARPGHGEPGGLAGRVDRRRHESEALRGNPAGDPHVREVPVYVPPGGDDGPLPAIFVLAAYTGRAQDMLETHPWRRGLVPRYDAAVAAGELPPALLVLPDAWTRLGGSQYVDSDHNGAYRRYVAEELVDWVDANYAVVPGARGVVGKSSGGFGALHLGMRHPERFPAVASISGDCNFEACYGPELLACLRGLLAHDGDPARFLEAFDADPDLGGDGHAVIMTLAMAAAYSPAPGTPLGFELPVDLETGERRADVWERWLAFDPLVDAPRHAEALRRLAFLHVECGLRDEFHLQWGARQLVRLLRALDVPVRAAEHPGGHRGLDPRVLGVLPAMLAALPGRA